MGLLRGKGRELQLQRLICPSWRGAFISFVYLVYALLVALCIADGFYPSPPSEQTVLQAQVRQIVKWWSFCLPLFICRRRIGTSLAKLLGAISLGLAGGGSQGAGSRGPQRLKTTRTGTGPGFSYVSCEMQGWRPNMEDAVVCAPRFDESEPQPGEEASTSGRALFGVMDGHGGSEVSAKVAEQLVSRTRAACSTAESAGAALKQAVLEIEEDLRRNNTHGRWRQMGCTAAVALLTPTQVSVASVGDSRVFKCRNGSCVPLTRDHKPESPRERRRIEAAGGTVAKFGPCYRVDACLNMSRALGDFLFKDPDLSPEQQKISPVPEITVSDIDDQDEFLVIACDGLFELMTWETVCEYIHQRLWTLPLAQIAEGLLDACCSTNVLATLGRGTDNESVIIVRLNRTTNHNETSSLVGSML